MSIENRVIVAIEASALAATMNEVRLWLDSMKIQPSGFKLMPTGVEIVFLTEHEAGRFREQFADPVSQPA